MRTVYDEEGNSFTVDSVDAREYLATGRFFMKQPVVSSEPKQNPKQGPEPEVKKAAKPAPKKATPKKPDAK